MSTKHSRTVARQLLRELGITPNRLYEKPPGRPCKLDLAGEQEVLDALECEETHASIGARLGISAKTIWRTRRKYANTQLQTSEVTKC